MLGFEQPCISIFEQGECSQGFYRHMIQLYSILYMYILIRNLSYIIGHRAILLSHVMAYIKFSKKSTLFLLVNL